MKESRKSCARFVHKFDAYAHPVTLTYNQQKSFATTQGGICSILTAIIIFYNSAVLALNYLTQEQFRWSINGSTIDPLSPEPYMLEQKDWSIITRIHSANATLEANIEKYVGGVYTQDIEYQNGTIGRQYVEAVKCDTVRHKLSP